MRYLWQHIEGIINSYDGSLPLSYFLKSYYKKYPKLGSRDRRMLSEMAYSWYRCGKAIDAGLSIQGKNATAVNLCSTENKHLQRFLQDIPVADNTIDLNRIFPHDIALSEGMDKHAWLKSMLTQPMLFIRVRNHKEKLAEILDEQAVPYSFVTDSCMAMPNGTAIDQWLPPFAYVVQDASSQATGDYFDAQPYEEWWDCCSGAGGKSLLLKDKEPLINLTVSDTRKTILNNLKERFRSYSHIMPVVYKTDVSNDKEVHDIMPDKLFDNIICDVPCSGSGTWARTPEQMFFFKPATLNDFAERQKKIVHNAATFLKPGGKLYYITCSVFKEENEQVVADLVNNGELIAEQATIINGITQHADSMFIAVIQKKD